MVPRRDEEFLHRRSKEARSICHKCPVYALSGFVILCVILLVFSLIVLRPRPPEVELSSASVRNLSYSTGSGNNSNNNWSAPWFNGTLSGEITIRNSNFSRFQFGKSRATVSYGGEVVGEVDLGGASVKAKGKLRREFVVGLRYNNSRDDMFNNGSLRLSGDARLVGTVHLIKIFDFRRTSLLNCTMTLILSSGSVQDIVCD